MFSNTRYHVGWVGLGFCYVVTSCYNILTLAAWNVTSFAHISYFYDSILCELCRGNIKIESLDELRIFFIYFFILENAG